MMSPVKKLGRKLVQGAKAEIKEGPIEIINTDKLWDAIECGLGLIALALLIFGGVRSPKQTGTTVINNIYINGIKQ